MIQMQQAATRATIRLAKKTRWLLIYTGKTFPSFLWVHMRRCNEHAINEPFFNADLGLEVSMPCKHICKLPQSHPQKPAFIAARAIRSPSSPKSSYMAQREAFQFQDNPFTTRHPKTRPYLCRILRWILNKPKEYPNSDDTIDLFLRSGVGVWTIHPTLTWVGDWETNVGGTPEKTWED